MKIQNDGIVLVGGTTSIPTASGTASRVQVQMTTGFGFSATQYEAGTGGAIAVLAKSRNATIGSNTIVLNGDTLGTIRFAGDDGVNLQSQGGNIQCQVDGTPGAGDIPGRLVFFTKTAGGGLDERMRITSAGRVGIGTTAPNVGLDVFGSQVRSSGATGGSYAQLNGGNVDGANIQLNRAGSATQNAFLGQFQGSLFLKNLDSGPIVFTNTTSDTERMRITSAGNILIGTDLSPTTGTQCLTVETGTAPTATPADTISVYSSDLSAGNTMLSIYTEGTSVNANTTAAATHRIAVRINGTVYYLLANTAA